MDKLAGARVRKVLKRVTLYLILVLLSVVFIIPIVMALIHSIMPTEQLVHSPLSLPTGIVLDRFYGLFSIQVNFQNNLINSFMLAGATSIATIFLGSLGAYGLSRFESRLTGAIRNLLFASYMVPKMMLAFSLVRIFADLRLINHIEGVVLAHLTITLPFTTLILWPFFDAIPRELDEAAQIDGAGRVRTFLSIIMPVALPGVVSLAIFSFILSWTDWTYAFFLLRSSSLMPVSLRISDFMINEYAAPWERALPAVVLVTVPLIVIFGLLQDRLVKGMGLMK